MERAAGLSPGAVAVLPLAIECRDLRHVQHEVPRPAKGNWCRAGEHAGTMGVVDEIEADEAPEYGAAQPLRRQRRCGTKTAFPGQRTLPVGRKIRSQARKEDCCPIGAVLATSSRV